MPEKTSWQRVARRIRVPMGFLFAAVFLGFAHPSAKSLLLSLPLVLAGLWLRGYASGYVRKDTELTTTGPYAYTRNPLYLGSMLIAFGFGAASANPWLLLALAALFLLIYLPTIQDEERFLREHFAGFSAYAAAVPRLLPRLTWPLPGASPGAFSRELYLRHREYNALGGAVALYAALAARIAVANYAQLHRLLQDIQAYLGS